MAGEMELDEDLDEISRRIDDPVRMYLTQMGEIPLLSRDQEISLAKKIEDTRKKFRRKVLECDYALRLVVDVLKKVNTGELPFDRTVKVSVTENLEKDQILGRMPHNLETLDHLMTCNDRDFRSLIRSSSDREAATDLHREHDGFREGEIVLGQQITRPVGVVHDEAQDRAVGGV